MRTPLSTLLLMLFAALGGCAARKGSPPAEPSNRSPGAFLEYHDVRDLIIAYRGDTEKVLNQVKANVTPKVWIEEVGVEMAMQDGYLAVTAPRPVQKAIRAYLGNLRDEEGLGDGQKHDAKEFNPVQEQEDQERIHPVQPSGE